MNGPRLAWLALAWVVGLATLLRLGAAEFGYTPIEVPLAPVSKPLLNDKGQVLTWENGTVYMYLPAADHGLEAGVHPMGPIAAGAAVLDFNTNGHFVTFTAPTVQGSLYKDGAVQSFPAETVLGLDQLGRALFYARHSSVREVDGSVTTLVPDEVFSYFFFNDINDAGLAVGHALHRSSTPGEHNYSPVTWDTKTGVTQILPITTPNSGAKLVNNKNQIFGWRHTLTTREYYLYLPAPDYGLPAGFTDVSGISALGLWEEGGSYDARLTDHGEIYIGQAGAPPTSIWQRGEIIRPDEHIIGPDSVTITRIFDINNKGAILATGTLSGRPGKLFILQPFSIGGFSITAPAADEIVPRGEPYTIRFDAPDGVETVDLYLIRTLSPNGPRSLLARGVPAAAGQYVWEVPEDMETPSTFLVAVDARDPGREGISRRFRVRQRWRLHRIIGTFQEPKYERINSPEHSWRFDQTDENLWPEVYWNRAYHHYWDTSDGFDPFIGPDVRYDPEIFTERDESEWPPWPAMVRAFGMPGAYLSPEPWTFDGVLMHQPNREAASEWEFQVLLDPRYNGVCYGLSMAMMAAFQDPERFDAKWLPGGGSRELGKFLPSSAGVRDAAHALQLYTWSQSDKSERQASSAQMTPRDVVERLKTMFERDDRDRDRFLIIQSFVNEFDEAGNQEFAAHAVVPYGMTNHDETTYQIAVYDPNFGSQGAQAIWVDLSDNSWWHSDEYWDGDVGQGLYFSSEAIGAFETATSPWPHDFEPGESNRRVGRAGTSPETLSVQIVGQAGAVTSAAGELRYERGVQTKTLSGGFISFPITGRPSQPDAYEIPAGGPYRAEAVPRTNGFAAIRISGGAVSSTLRQTGASPDTRLEVDLLEKGMSVVRGGAGRLELSARVPIGPGGFDSIRVTGLTTENPAGVRLTAAGEGFRLEGPATPSTYHLELDHSGSTGRRIFHRAEISLAAGATHTIQPAWGTLGEGPVTIDIDRDGDGRTDETKVVENQAPSTLVWPGYVAGTPVNPNLITRNNGFESQPVGTRVGLPPVVADGATFTGWRVFNVTTNSVDFSATLIAQASIGTRAMRLAVTNTAGTANHALDQWLPAMHTPVRLGQRYVVSFDAAWIAGLGAGNLLFQVQEFDGAGNFLGNGLSALQSVSTPAYQAHTFIYQPVNPATAGIGLFFGPLRGVVGTTTISLDNVRMEVAPLVVNGDFDSCLPAASAGGPGAFVNTSTFPGWRLFSVGSPPIDSLTGTVVDAGGYPGGHPGSHALMLSVTNTGSPSAHDYGLDNNNVPSPVVTGRTYTLSFDVALVGVGGGSMALNASVAEFNAAGAFTGTQGGFAPVLPADQAFHRYTLTYVVTNPATTQVVIAFRPVTTGRSTLVLDNVVLAPLVAETPARLSFGVNGATLSLAWPPSHLGWRAQSNSVSVGNPGAWFDIRGSESVTNLSLPMSPTAPAVYYRLRRP